MTDLFDDPEAREWAQHALNELIPKLRDSAATISILPDEAGIDDIKFALELGLSIMLDKPLIVAVVPGRRVPAHLARAADRLIEFDDKHPGRTGLAIQTALSELLDEPPC